MINLPYGVLLSPWSPTHPGPWPHDVNHGSAIAWTPGQSGGIYP